ncbi:MAG: O-antigen ligase family protein [Bacteroidota bacterium]
MSSIVPISNLPILGNDPLRDVKWMILLIPFWWILGVEQFVYSIILSLCAFKIIVQKGKAEADYIVLLYLLFLAVYVLSFFYIVESKRVLTFARNFSAYYSAALLMFVFYNVNVRENNVTGIINAIIFVLIFSSFLGLLGIFGIFRSEFTSVIGYVLPSFITNTTYGGLIAERNIGINQWFVVIGKYFRLSGLFLFSTFYASTIALTFPLFWYKFKMAQSRKTRMLLFVAILVLLLNLIFTTGRVAMASLMAGMVYIYLFHPDTISRYNRLILFSVASISVLIISMLYFWQEIQLILDAVIYARSGSANARLNVYIATINGFLERPFFGWGTEQDMAGLRYPAGSHSNYLGLLYKQGIFGFLIMAIIYLFSWLKIAKNTHIQKQLKRGIQGMFIIILLNGMTDVLDLDATTFMIAWVILGLGIYGGKNSTKYIRVTNE